MNHSEAVRPKYSVIVPVYNRVDEVEELLESLLFQVDVAPSVYEVIVVEDGSTIPCGYLCEAYKWKGLNVKYLSKDNEGRSIARNYGIQQAQGDWLIFFDSDCIIPEDYFAKLEKNRQLEAFDCFGGPDAAHSSFTPTQKAINLAMTSFLTTGGIRGGKKSMEKFTPRTFNMGIRRDTIGKVGGFREMYSEDIDMSTRIKNAGYKIGLLPDQYVYHKRRVDFKKFFKQVNVFGKSRITLHLLYPGSLKLVHLLPAFFLLGSIACIVLGCLVSPWWLLPLALFSLALMLNAIVSTGSMKIAILAIPASFIQLYGYGLGFLEAFYNKIVLRKGRDINEEIMARKGK